MAKRIYGFIVDEALQKWSSNALLVTDLDQGAGVATQNVIEYFNELSILKDSRGSRFTHYLTGGLTMYGKLGFIIDNLPPNNEGSTVTEEDSGAIPGDVIDVSKIENEEMDHLFNIIEDCLYARSTGSGDLVTTFLNGRFASSSTYTGYVTDSIKISSDSAGEDFMSGIEGRSSDGNIVSSRMISLPKWVEFGFRTSYYGEIRFKLWVSRDNFLANYPLVTVTDVVLPCEAECLADPSKLGTTPGSDTQGTTLKTLIDSGLFMNSVYKNNFNAAESSGVYMFQASYFPETYVTPPMSIPFAVVYKGHAPDISLVKKAIRNKLLASGIMEEIWVVAFPELFTAAKFYLIPYWGNTFSARNTESGISKWQDAYNKFKAVFPYYDQVELDARLEIMLNDATNLIIAVIPQADNDANKTIKRLHPTYVPVDAERDSSAWANQELKTRVFNQQLTYAIADAREGSVDSEHTDLSEIMVDCGTESNEIRRKFITFTKYNCEYYVLVKSEWDAL